MYRYLADGLDHTSRLTFGRETAQFKQLLGMMAIVSVVLWSCVLITMLARLWYGHIWYRRRHQPQRINTPPT
jgi:hypothetical protein